MKSFGVIAEFNPFHSGHRYLLEETRRITGAEICISAMSGEFVQRGDYAFFSKWERASMAVKNGVDVVCEIPQIFACSSADYFAKGGMTVLNAFGNLDYLAFGSECGDSIKLTKTAKLLKDNEKEINDRVALLIKDGNSYPAAREIATCEIFVEDLPLGSNDILALEYLKYLEEGCTPVAIKRTGDSHNVSASKIRDELKRGNPSLYEKAEHNFYNMLMAKIFAMSEDEIEKIDSASGGLGNKLKKEIRRAENLNELIESLKSKAYTRTRISRLLVQSFLNIKKDLLKSSPKYIRILAMSDRGAKYIKECKKAESLKLPIISNLNKFRASSEIDDSMEEQLKTDILASDLYNLIFEKNLYQESDFVKMPELINF